MLLALALAPLLVTLDSWEGWKSMAAERGWQWVAYEQSACNDGALLAIKTLIGQRTDVDPTRIYLAGRGEMAACVFYNASRAPDLWAAALAIGGDSRKAIETNRLFAANLSMTPLLWVANPDPHSQNAARRDDARAGHRRGGRRIPRQSPTRSLAAENRLRNREPEIPALRVAGDHQGRRDAPQRRTDGIAHPRQVPAPAWIRVRSSPETASSPSPEKIPRSFLTKRARSGQSP